MTEFELIAHLTRDLPPHPAVVVGPGDDCAVLEAGHADRWLLLKTDAVVEGVHFTTETEPERIGHKALARGLSDIAAMGGLPEAALVTLALPAVHDPMRAEGIYRGLRALADRHHVAVVGGETTTLPSGLLLSIAVTGWVRKDRCVLRSGAKPGDAIFVTGELGGSLAGKHLDFEPRLAEARWLAENFALHAMIDLSDGLAGDLRHLLHQSRVGAELHANTIPISRAARVRAQAGSHAKPPLAAALTDGEDFELLFTLPSAQAVPLLDGFRAAFPSVKLTCIGRISAEPGLRLRDRQGIREIATHGYVHFAKS